MSTGGGDDWWKVWVIYAVLAAVLAGASVGPSIFAQSKVIPWPGSEGHLSGGDSSDSSAETEDPPFPEVEPPDIGAVAEAVSKSIADIDTNTVRLTNCNIEHLGLRLVGALVSSGLEKLAFEMDLQLLQTLTDVYKKDTLIGFGNIGGIFLCPLGKLTIAIPPVVQGAPTEWREGGAPFENGARPTSGVAMYVANEEEPGFVSFPPATTASVPMLQNAKLSLFQASQVPFVDSIPEGRTNIWVSLEYGEDTVE